MALFFCRLQYCDYWRRLPYKKNFAKVFISRSFSCRMKMSRDDCHSASMITFFGETPCAKARGVFLSADDGKKKKPPGWGRWIFLLFLQSFHSKLLIFVFCDEPGFFCVANLLQPNGKRLVILQRFYIVKRNVDYFLRIRRSRGLIFVDDGFDRCGETHGKIS